jgi:hypothetical protein
MAVLGVLRGVNVVAYWSHYGTKWMLTYYPLTTTKEQSHGQFPPPTSHFFSSYISIVILPFTSSPISQPPTPPSPSPPHSHTVLLFSFLYIHLRSHFFSTRHLILPFVCYPSRFYQTSNIFSLSPPPELFWTQLTDSQVSFP